MIILSHRGLWRSREERNSRVAFLRSFDSGLGTETDLRDVAGKIVISHDMPSGDELSFEDLLQLLAGRNLPLALNIKADGLIDEVLRLLDIYGHTNYFTFDMSIPDQIVQLSRGAVVFTSVSEKSFPIELVARSTGVWLDAFERDWWHPEFVDGLLSSGKRVCCVSEDLHGRDVESQWRKILQIDGWHSENLMLCTDLPEKARRFFNV